MIHSKSLLRVSATSKAKSWKGGQIGRRISWNANAIQCLCVSRSNLNEDQQFRLQIFRTAFRAHSSGVCLSTCVPVLPVVLISCSSGSGGGFLSAALWSVAMDLHSSGAQETESSKIWVCAQAKVEPLTGRRASGQVKLGDSLFR